MSIDFTEWRGRVEEFADGDRELIWRVHELGSQLFLWAAGIRGDLLSFFHDRLKVWLRDSGARHDLIDAVVTPQSDDLLHIVRRVRALQELVESDDGANLLVAYRRAANIIAAEEKKAPLGPLQVAEKRLALESELELFKRLKSGCQRGVARR